MGAIPVSLRPLVLLTPSQAAAVELPRRVASTGRAIAGVYAMKPLTLARVLAEPVLLGRGLAHWTPGHDALVAARLLAENDDAGLRFPEGTPRAPVAAALARTLAALRRAGIPQPRLSALAERRGRKCRRRATARGARRALRRLPRAPRGAHARIPVTVLAAARERLAHARWLEGAEVLVADDLELEPDEIELVAALAARFPVRVLRRALPASLRPCVVPRAARRARRAARSTGPRRAFAATAPSDLRQPRSRACARRSSSRRAARRSPPRTARTGPSSS